MTTKKQQETNRHYQLSTLINILFIIFEMTMGFLIGSIALLSDAVHNLGDVLGIVVAFVGMLLSRRAATKVHTYGLRNASILAAFINSILLFISIAFVAYEAITHLIHPASSIPGMTIVWVAAIGVVINGLTAFIFKADAEHDLNERGVYMHFIADAALSVAVMISGIAIQLTGWTILDPIISLVAIAYVFYESLDLFRDTWNLVTNGVPSGIDETQVAQYLLGLPDVKKINDLHIWGISTTETALSAHLQCGRLKGDCALVDTATEGLRKRFNIEHVTIQLDGPGKKHHEADI